jgi:hypothetical protein
MVSVEARTSSSCSTFNFNKVFSSNEVNFEPLARCKGPNLAILVWKRIRVQYILYLFKIVDNTKTKYLRGEHIFTRSSEEFL